MELTLVSSLVKIETIKRLRGQVDAKGVLHPSQIWDSSHPVVWKACEGVELLVGGILWLNYAG